MRLITRLSFAPRSLANNILGNTLIQEKTKLEEMEERGKKTLLVSPAFFPLLLLQAVGGPGLGKGEASDRFRLHIATRLCQS